MVSSAVLHKHGRVSEVHRNRELEGFSESEKLSTSRRTTEKRQVEDCVAEGWEEGQ